MRKTAKALKTTKMPKATKATTTTRVPGDVIDCVEVHEYSFEVRNMAPAVDTSDYHDTYFTYQAGAKAEVPRFVVVVKTQEGGRGEYAPSQLAGHGAVAQTVALAPRLLGQDPFAREAVYDEMDNIFPPPYAGDYSDQLDSIDSDGCVAVPEGPGLGVTYDWEYIERKRIKVHEFRV